VTEDPIPWETVLSPYCEMPKKQTQLLLNEYLTVLLQWNKKTNLTSIRDKNKIVCRHFGESLFAARQVPASVTTLLDVGSGGGFPGVPIQIARPDIAVTLADAHAKKVAFLREVTRRLGLGCEVFGGRVESMPAGKKFGAVTLRAVEKMAEVLPVAAERVEPDGVLLVMTTLSDAPSFSLEGFVWGEPVKIPGSESRVVLVGTKTVLP
jgi:16S rRNA (guanine527-N7)-methyltransferase